MALTQVSTEGIKNGTITGTDLATNIDLVDNQRLRLGTGNDLEIFHNNDNSFINDSGTGQLLIQASGLRLRNYPEGHTQVNCQDDVVELYYDNSKKLETKSDGIDVTGEVQCDSLDVDGGFNIDGSQITYDASVNIMKFTDNAELRFGSGNDLRIVHGGTNSTIRNLTGQLQLRSDSIVFENNDGSDFATVTGIRFGDNNKARFGNSDDLQIYHNGTTNVIAGASTASDINIEAFTGAGVNLISNGNHYAVKCISNAQVELYHDNVKRFETTSAGNEVSGNLVVGTVTLDGGGLSLSDNDKLKCGNGDDLQIYHDGSHSRITNSTGALSIQADDININNAANNEQLATFTANGAVELFYDHSKKFETTSGGAEITGSFNITGELNFIGNGAKYIDVDTLTNSNSLTIRHRSDANAFETAATFVANGAASFTHNGTTRLATTSSGVSVTGGITVSADSSFGHSIIFDDTKGIRLSHDNQTDGNDGTIAAGPFGSGLNIVGVQTQAGTGREVRMWGRVFPSTNSAEDLGVSTNRWNKLYVNQVLFNGDTAAANALDDYEEGTWTPGNNDMSVTVHYARYTKVGRFVHIVADVEYASTPSDTSQVGYLTGLPFTNGNKSVHQNLPWFGTSSANNNQFFNTWFTPLIFANDDKFSFLDSRYGTYLPRSTLAGKKVRINSTYYTSY